MKTRASGKLPVGARLLLALGALLLVGTYYVSVWRIELWAPQYPEGLVMSIWLDHLTGNIESINNLNHYIGMKTVHEESFPEFRILPAAIGVLIGMGALAALLGRRWAAVAWLVALVLFLTVAMVDFYRWEYDYGHNLDPKAPIKVEGMSYQPPLIGYKQLLNFEAYSLPDTGAWLIGIATLLAALAVGWSFWRRPGGAALALLLGASFLTGCEAKPRPVRIGEECVHCRMQITAPQYAAELVTVKGRQYVFDDLACLLAFMGEASSIAFQDPQLLAADFRQPSRWLPVQQAVFVRSAQLRTPMNGHTVAFASATEARTTAAKLNPAGAILTWSDVRSELVR